MVGGLKMCLLGVASVVTLGCLNKANNGVDIPVVLISESGRIRLTDGRTVSSIEDGVNFLPMRGDWSMGVEIALDNGITVGDLFKGMGILSVAGVWDFYVKGGGGGRMLLSYAPLGVRHDIIDEDIDIIGCVMDNGRLFKWDDLDEYFVGKPEWLDYSDGCCLNIRGKFIEILDDYKTSRRKVVNLFCASNTKQERFLDLIDAAIEQDCACIFLVVFG